MTISAPTLWNYDGIQHAWDSPLVRKALDKAQPPREWLHSSPSNLVSEAPRIIDASRAAYPNTEVAIAIAGSTDGPNPTNAWLRVGALCDAHDIGKLQFDIEGDTWIHRPAGTLRNALNAVHEKYPKLELTVNGYGQPLYIPNVFPPPAMTGFSNDWANIMAEFGGIDAPTLAYYLQVYYATTPLPDDWLLGLRSWARAHANMAVALGRWIIRPGLRWEGYQQMHNCRTDTLCAVAVLFNVCNWWALNGAAGYSDDMGIRAMWAIAELERKGFIGPNAILDFQRKAGLTVDGRVGPKTLAALGVVWP